MPRRGLVQKRPQQPVTEIFHVNSPQHMRTRRAARYYRDELRQSLVLRSIAPKGNNFHAVHRIGCLYAAYGGSAMQRSKHLSLSSVTVTGIATSVLLGLAAVTVSAPPAGAVVYCQYVGYPQGCVARAGVVLRPRPVARAAVRQTVGSNANGGVNRVGPRR